MRKEFKAFSKWLGEWAGKGQTKKGLPVHSRLVLRERMAGEFLEFEVTSLHADTGALVHGVVCQLAIDPDGVMRMSVASTMHGCMVMPMTPEDPGAAAIEGVSATGNRVVVSLVEEDGGLMLTSYWRAPNTAPDAEPLGFTNLLLKRVTREA
jgi:hypothetical protein